MIINTNDIRIASSHPLISPAELKEDLGMTEESNKTVVESRKIITDILEKKDNKMICIVGPCSIHDPKAAIDYAEKLKWLSDQIKDEIYIIMRVYFEKPRTTLGWRGLIVDPNLDGSYDIAKGLHLARKLLLDITSMGLPVGSEMLDPIVPQYISDLISWASIGARTTESQIHREMASGLSMPVGFKNGTSGNYQLALDAIHSSIHSHSFIGIDQGGQTCVLKTTGNRATNIIIRGGCKGQNYYEENVEEVESHLKALDIDPSIVIDCSHANSGKVPIKQERVLRSIIDQRVRGRHSIIGFMIESNLKEGKQTIPSEKEDLIYGFSVTDPCIDWEKTVEILTNAHSMLKKEEVWKP
jgi:3-deoxy-7-phosphoheptulonate synthase